MELLKAIQLNFAACFVPFEFRPFFFFKPVLLWREYHNFQKYDLSPCFVSTRCSKINEPLQLKSKPRTTKKIIAVEETKGTFVSDGYLFSIVNAIKLNPGYC